MFPILLKKSKDYKNYRNAADCQSNYINTYDVETFNTDRAIVYTVGFYPFSKNLGIK